MTEEREELDRVRERLEAERSELGAAIDDLRAQIDGIESDLDAAVWGRNAATERLLPDDRLPESVSNDTRDAIASYVDTTAETGDVRSEQLAMKRDELGVETKNAADAREDIDETATVIDRVEVRTDEAESMVAEVREELDAARSTFETDLAVLADRLATFDVALSEDTLETVIDDRIPGRKSELLATIESARARVSELSTRRSKLEADRDKLQSIAGGGTCPACNQNVGPDRTDSEVDAIEAELHHVERQLGAAERDRDGLVARRAELADLGDRAIALGSFRSETVAGAADRLEDRQEALEDNQADLDEERAEQAEQRAERDRADAAIATLETEIRDLEAEIEGLQATVREGKAVLESFVVVDQLRGRLEERTDELADLQEQAEEMETELTSLDAEIEGLSDDE